VSFGAGGAAGSLASGYAWETIGPAMTFGAAGMLALLGAIFAWHWVEHDH
jgi:PPP family 3-phenylpropionic acid transporter